MLNVTFYYQTVFVLGKHTQIYTKSINNACIEPEVDWQYADAIHDQNNTMTCSSNVLSLLVM